MNAFEQDQIQMPEVSGSRSRCVTRGVVRAVHANRSKLTNSHATNPDHSCKVKVTPGSQRLAVTKDGHTTFSPGVVAHPKRREIEAHEAVHRAQFANLGRRPKGAEAELEAEARIGAKSLQAGRLSHPTLATPAGVQLAYDPSADGAATAGRKRYRDSLRGYEVEIDAFGMIHVKPGDWLSKYSFAIHGHPWNVYEYGRGSPSGDVVPIADVDVIQAGKTLYHLPTLRGENAEIVAVTVLQIPSEDEKARLLLDHLRRSEEISAYELKLLKTIYDSVGVATNAIDLLMIADDFVRIPGVIGSVSEVLGAIGIPLMVVGFAFDIDAAYTVGTREFKHVATVDAAVAWAFDDSSPRPPETSIENVRKWKGDDDAQRYADAWNEAVVETNSKLREAALRRYGTQLVLPGEAPLPPETRYKLVMRAAANNDRNVLREMFKTPR